MHPNGSGTRKCLPGRAISIRGKENLPAIGRAPRETKRPAPGRCLRGNWTTAPKQHHNHKLPARCFTYPNASNARRKLPWSRRAQAKLVQSSQPVSRRWNRLFPVLLIPTSWQRPYLRGQDTSTSPRGGKGRGWVPRVLWSRSIGKSEAKIRFGYRVELRCCHTPA